VKAEHPVRGLRGHRHPSMREVGMKAGKRDFKKKSLTRLGKKLAPPTVKADCLTLGRPGNEITSMQRSNGNFLLRATKEGKNPVLRHLAQGEGHVQEPSFKDDKPSLHGEVGRHLGKTPLTNIMPSHRTQSGIVLKT